MSLVNYHNKCRLCGNTNLQNVLNLGEHYLHGSFIFPDFNPPLRKVPVILQRCSTTNKGNTDGCGLVQLANSIDPDILYARYGYRSGTNQTMRNHLDQIAKKTSKLWKEKNIDVGYYPSVLDIGCNDGYLLRKYPDDYQKVGIDPCDLSKSIVGIKNFHFINDIFPSNQLTGEYDIMTMIACFYDVNNPLQTARAFQYRLKKNGILVIEVSYWPEKMRQGAIDEICQEHVCFYNFQNLEKILSEVGLCIFDVYLNDINGGSIQIWACKPEGVSKYINETGNQNILNIKMREFSEELDTFIPYEKFNKKVNEDKQRINNLFNTIKNNNETVHLYGASTKGNVLLQWLNIDSSIIPYAAERSKDKWGGSTLGTNIKMISEEESRAMKPDYYFVPIWGFKKEIINREQEYLNNGGKLIFPLPELEIIQKQ
jgi:SAM-dependent methyltransferase